MPQINFGDDIKCMNGLVLSYRTVSSTPTTISSTSGTGGTHDYMIGVNTSSGPITINLPTDNVACVVGRTYVIFDKTGNAATAGNPHHHITIDAGLGSLINGSRTKEITSNYNSITVCCVDATSGAVRWNII